jgi:hypothetical protein
VGDKYRVCFGDIRAVFHPVFLAIQRVCRGPYGKSSTASSVKDK